MNQRVYFPYLPSDDLKEAVNLAIALERPLLLEGEPGCGKTRLAGAVANEFTHKYLQNNEQTQQQLWDYYIWNIKSTTRARDGLYTYDAVARLRDAQLVGSNTQQLKEFIGYTETEQLKRRLWNKKNYREFGALGKALQKHSLRPILLIDEIDKADSDFANDLLLELEELRFEVPETRESFLTPEKKPIIFITSNREKPLPEPFLRRCLYFFVKFPKEEQLKEIIKNRFGKFEKEKEELVEEAITRFYEIRKQLENIPGIRPPGTSEFIEFLTALLYREDVDNALQDLKNLSQKLPLLGTLLKTKQAQDMYQKQ
ncbi:MAG: MoxR family ATPase [Rhizonema sp. PD38]|nr:MoxR family ATPase [Rhizonema sp. PD38]